ncbi:MAG: lactate utilization protein [Desulfococcus sp. 4484_241]|nr:MAG: lactate utilization protein [Desulfococcus sp. 4484_241]
MKNHVQNYWTTKMEQVKNSFEANNFEVHVVRNSNDAAELVLNRIMPALSPKSLGWGGSQTFISTGLYDRLKGLTEIEVIDTFDKSIPSEQALERRRKALLTDLFITGSNAVTETGELVNLDMIGNRVAALAFGPKNVVVLAGRNKIVPDIDAGIARIKDYAAPVNAMRLEKKTPCSKTASCHDCSSPDRICNTWVITEKSFPKGRIILVLINEDLGL